MPRAAVFFCADEPVVLKDGSYPKAFLSLPLSVLFQGVNCHMHKSECPAAFRRFWFPEDDAFGLRLTEGLSDAEDAVVQVHVRPAQSQNLPASHAGGDGQWDQNPNASGLCRH